jgi:hypothetical protein
MMKLVHLPVLLLFPLFAHSQGPAPTSSRWSVGVMGTSAMTHRTLLNKDGSDQSDMIISLRDDAEVPRFGYGGKLMIARHLDDRWTIGIGVSYMRFGYQSDYEVSDLTFGDLIDPRRGFIYSTTTVPPTSFRYIDDYQYIGIPLEVQRSWGTKRFRPLVGASITPSYLLEASTITRYEYSDGSSDRNRTSVRSDFNAFNLFATVQAGCGYNIGERLQVHVQPYGSVGVLDVIDAPISGWLWSVGVQAGVDYRL